MVIQNTYSHFLYRQFFITPKAFTKSDRDLTGATGIVTGSNSGLGYHACQQLLSLGLSGLILAVRDTNKGESAKASLLSDLGVRHESQKPQIEVWELDMMSYESILEFTNRVRDTAGLRVDFAILNAGVVRVEFGERNGNEITILTNWLGTALLASALRPVLQAQYDEARSKGTKSASLKVPVLSIVGSDVAQMAIFRERKVAAKEHTSVMRQLNEKKNFDRVDRYYTSKLLLLMFFREFCERLEKAGNEVVVNIVTPGFCYGSDLHRSIGGVLGKIFGAVKRILGRSTPVGARTLVHAAVVAGNESHGKYLMDQRIAPFADYMDTENGKEITKQMWGELGEELQKVIGLEHTVTVKSSAVQVQ